ncbi:MAG: TRAP transporter TatT component family protein [Spirochaetia bacterium]
MFPRLLPAVVLSTVMLLCSCSINQLAVRAVAGFLSGTGESTTFSGDDDPELVRDALPFAMKTYEALLEADPKNAPLALATGRSFVSYSFAFVQAPSDQMPAERVDAQRAMRLRAKKLDLRAREYVLRGLELRRPGFRAALEKSGPAAALRLTRREDVDYLYWAGAAWMAAFSADPFDFAQIVTLPRAVALLQQVEDWDDAYGAGAVHEIFISYYGSAPADLGGSEQKARGHFARALELSRGLRAGPYIALAASVSVKNQNVEEYRDLLGKALAVDVNADLPDRLVNIINQRRARWMLDHIDDYFIEGDGT